MIKRRNANYKNNSILIATDLHIHQLETIHHLVQPIHSKHYLNIQHILIQILTYWIPHPQTLVHPLHILLIE